VDLVGRRSVSPVTPVFGNNNNNSNSFSHGMPLTGSPPPPPPPPGLGNPIYQRSYLDALRFYKSAYAAAAAAATTTNQSVSNSSPHINWNDLFIFLITWQLQTVYFLFFFVAFLWFYSFWYTFHSINIYII
jgi:hypothetical protein